MSEIPESALKHREEVRMANARSNNPNILDKSEGEMEEGGYKVIRFISDLPHNNLEMNIQVGEGFTLTRSTIEPRFVIVWRKNFGCDDIENLVVRHMSKNGFDDNVHARYGTALGLLMNILSGITRVEDLLQEINKH